MLLGSVVMDVIAWDHTFSSERPIKVLTANKRLWIVTHTLCKALSLKDPDKALNGLNRNEHTVINLPHEDEKGITNIDFHCVSIEGAYCLIFRAGLDIKSQFLLWFNQKILV